MRYFRLPVGLLLLGAAAGCVADDTSAADDKRAQRAPSLEEDLAGLQGKWKQLRPSGPGSVYLGFDKDGLRVAHAFECRGKTQATPFGAEGVSTRGASVDKFDLKERGKGRVITPGGNGEGLSAITYRLDGDTLVIGDGACDLSEPLTGGSYRVSLKGEWKRLRGDVEKLQGEWKPVKRLGGGDVALEFAWETLKVAGIPPEVDGARGPDLQTVLFEVKERGEKRALTFSRKNKAAAITYRFDGGTLVIEDGEWNKVSLKGGWRRVGRERVREADAP
jgi:hypothetical protein